MEVRDGQRIGDDAVALMRCGTAVVISTVGPDLRPHITRAWGPAVSDDRTTVGLCVAVAGAPGVLAGLEALGEVAINFTRPTTYRALQLKGTVREVHETTAEELEHAQRHFDAFCQEAIAVGVGPRVVERFLLGPDFVTATIAVRELYDQTPGPAAGTTW